jgi:SAM-dependent methyltransferase
MAKINIEIDNDSSLCYERNNFIKKAFNTIFIPTLNILPPQASSIIKKSHNSAKKVLENATNHAALETLYNKGLVGDSNTILSKIFQSIWFNLNNAKAVRNRLKIVKREFKKALLDKSLTKDYIHILSIASGSSRAIIEVLSDAEVVDKIDLDLVSVTFLDKNPKAIEYSKKLAEKVPNYNFSWINKTAGDFFREYDFKDKFDIVEMVGLLDYFTDEKSVEIFKDIKSILKPTGVLITANINDNSEREFITKTVGWPMIYKSAEDLLHILENAGYKSENMKVMYEPFKIHSVAVIINK